MPERICSVPDCTKPAGLRRGWCAMHYSRWLRHGDVNVVLRQRRTDIPPETRFGHWTLLKLAEGRRGATWYLCRCDCGTERTIPVQALIDGRSKSCGCWGWKEFNTTHGMYGTPEYEAWQSLKRRCTYPETNGYQNYGGRGITVCDEWQRDFLAFYNHIGPKPGPDYSVDRIDVNGNYEPGNVRWATPKQQANNRRRRF